MKRISVALLQSEINREAIEKKLLEVLASKDSSNVEKTDGFLKFISDSRDAAFKYIEEVQSAINEFVSRIGPIVKHYKETGRVLERKPSELVKELAQAYDKLVDSMPKEDHV